MIHLVIREPIEYQRTLCRALNDHFRGAFVAWFHESTDGHSAFSPDDETFCSHILSQSGYWQLAKALRSDSAPVLILGSWSDGVAYRSILAAAVLRVPFFVWADHPHPREGAGFKQRLRCLYVRFLSRLAVGFLGCGRPTVEHLIGLGIPADKVFEFPYWVDVPAQWTLPRGCDRDHYQDPLRLIAIGRHVSIKQFDVAVRAVHQVNGKARRPSVELVLVGDGPESTTLQTLAASLGCENAVFFRGWLKGDHLFGEIENADVLVIPSKFEPYGVVVLEAMARGRPVLASDTVVAARDRDEGNGAVKFHPTGDVHALADQIITLRDDRAQLRRAAEAARMTAEKWPASRAPAVFSEILSMTAHRRSSERRKLFESTKDCKAD